VSLLVNPRAAFRAADQHIISMPTSYSGLDMTLKQMRPGRRSLVSLFKPATASRPEAALRQRATCRGSHIRMVLVRECHYRNQDAFRLPHLDREVLTVRYPAQCEAGFLLTEGEQDPCSCGLDPPDHARTRPASIRDGAHITRRAMERSTSLPARKKNLGGRPSRNRPDGCRAFYPGIRLARATEATGSPRDRVKQ